MAQAAPAPAHGRKDGKNGKSKGLFFRGKMGRIEQSFLIFPGELWPNVFCDVRLALGSIFQLRVQLGFSLQGKAAPKASPTEMEIGLLQPARTWGAPGETLKPWAKMGNMR